LGLGENGAPIWEEAIGVLLRTKNLHRYLLMAM